uniref:Flowering time control protein FPA n=1 Tax=Rhizophora mucronata TaxID=61149 RepID=A0A2P2JP98_RHIMU
MRFLSQDKSSIPTRDEDYLRGADEQRSALRGSPFSQRGSKVHNASPDHFYSEKSKMSDRSAEPSEVLWIGFPALLKVDEMTLRKSFSPFGEIEKITVFPGRSYAFVRFRSLLSACRAKETLQGKLFGNPLVHICFAKSEASSSNRGRTPHSPHFKSNGHPGASDNFQQERSFGSLTSDPSLRSPHFISNLDPGEADLYGFNRKGTMFPGGGDAFDNRRFEEELGPPPDVYECRGSPAKERSSHFDELTQKFPQKGPFFEEPWDFPDDSYPFHGAKKLKTGSFPPDRELPEYPFSGIEQEKQVFTRASPDFSHAEAFEKNYEMRSLGYNPVSDQQINLPLPHGERRDHWKASCDNLQAGPGTLPSNPVGRKRFTPEPEQSSLDLWKWEGTIAKGGTPVCRARALKVGKVLDVMLPEFLDCTARTGLDMLAKHYYQAASAWVIFFVPASDADMGCYNEFMHYLEEKQRAAVAKLDDKTTLFLVPPSDFSEKVLRVPGKLSISGVVLRLEHPGSNIGPPHYANERRNANFSSSHRDLSYPKLPTSSGHLPSMTTLPDLGKAGGDRLFLGNVDAAALPAAFSGSSRGGGDISDFRNENRHDYQWKPLLGPNWSPHHPQNIISGNKSKSPQVSNTSLDQEHHLVMPRILQDTSSMHDGGGISSTSQSGNSQFSLQETQHSVSSSVPIVGLQPQQLAQLASSLLGQQRQLGSNQNVSEGEYLRQASSMHQSDGQLKTAHMHSLHNKQVGSEIPMSQFGQMQQQQSASMPTVVPFSVQREPQPSSQGNPPPMQSAEDADADPQKRLQATLQLAAALLQQIQQGKGT